MPDATVSALRKATKGLLYPSESDEPFRAFVWEGDGGDLTGEKVLGLARKARGTAVEEVDLKDFFQDLTTEQDGTEEEKADIERYKGLLAVLRERLTDVKVFRVGDVTIDVFIVGRTEAGQWAGVRTKAVET